MTNWAFDTWPRIIAGAILLSSAFGLAHLLGRIVTGMEGVANAETAAIFVLVLGGYLIIGAMHYRNPEDGRG
ncbi:MAG: hypothetical protein HKN29_16300 [Rhodothermales bacterium]|nr:hypothetical protein [Rhodothermales bacterium]